MQREGVTNYDRFNRIDALIGVAFKIQSLRSIEVMK
jgi:hypothetical protein